MLNYLPTLVSPGTTSSGNISAPSWRVLWKRSHDPAVPRPSPIHITTAIALAENWHRETPVMSRMEGLGIDLSSNVLPSLPYLYFNPAGVEKFYRELRDRKGRYF